MSLSLKRAAKRFADTLIFEDVNLELNPSERVGLLGRNGSGKTTLLRILAGLDQPDAGEVTRFGRVSYLAQRGGLEAGLLRDAVLPEAHLELKRNLELAGCDLETPTPEHLEAFAKLEESYRVLGGYELETRAEEILAGLDLSGDWRADALSGGQTRRALLARLLISPAEFYLLDEPTNHLDLDSIHWLESWIGRSEAGFLIVSHDRDFLDATVTRCLELERQRLNQYPGNYTAAMAEKRIRLEAAKIAFQQHERKITRLEAEAAGVKQYAEAAGRFDQRKKTWGHTMQAKNKAQNVSRTLANRAKALEKRIEHMGEVEKPFEDQFLTRIKLQGVTHGPNEILTLENLTLTRGSRAILEHVNLHVRRGERIALIGENGSGKSTLLQAINGQLKNGQLEVANGVIRYGVGLTRYWAGQNTEELDAFPTLEVALLGANDDLKTREVYALLASLGLPKEPSRPIATLSGGQRTRLSLARLSVTKAHLLVLDEPTNNLDLDAVEALERLLLEYPGTVLFASHDRRLVREAATRRWEVRERRVTDLGDLLPVEYTTDT